jgi:D-psicose/D-tagatose/L-ribulose 3-epimerase
MIRGAAISNIAWPSLAETEALVLARQAGFTGIEIAPAKSVARWPDQPRDVLDLRRRIEAEGLSVAALQAILFGMTGVELFASEATRQRLFNHFVMLARVAGQLGASACVYGAPRMRDPGPLEAAPALDLAVDFFRSVAPVFAAEGTCLAFEANAEMYGCRFITRTREAIELVRRVDHPGFRLQIDTGTMLINGEDDGVISESVPLATHFHVSERDLAPPGTTGARHEPLARALASTAYSGWVSVEMREVEDWRKALAASARFLETTYHIPLAPRSAAVEGLANAR